MVLIVLAVVLGLLVTFYLVISSIIRSTIARTQLAFRSVIIELIEDDRFHLRAQLELSNTGSIPATIIAPLTINVNDVGTVIHNESVDIVSDAQGPTVFFVDGPFIVSDLKKFRHFSRSLIFEPSVVWTLTAEVKIRPLTQYMFSYSRIPFHKQVKLNALNGLHDLNIGSLSLKRSDAHHVFIDITIDIRNPSLFNIDLGRLYFILQHKNYSIGYVETTSENSRLSSNENVITFSGELQSDSVQAYQALSDVIQNFLTNKTSQIEVLAGPNATSHSLLAPGLIGLSLNVPMLPFDEKIITSLAFKSMTLIPSTRRKKVTLSASIIIEINSPLGQRSPLDVQTMNMSVLLTYNGNSVGTLNVSQAFVERLDETRYESRFTNKLLTLSGTGKAYKSFASKFILANESNPIQFRVVGTTSIKGLFALGPLNVDGIPIENDVCLSGLDGLCQVHVDGISINEEEERALQLSINVTITNPGIAEVQLRNFTLHLTEAKRYTKLGDVLVDTLVVRPGANKTMLRGRIAPSNEQSLSTIGSFFSAYLNGKTQTVILFHNSLPIQNETTAMDLTVSGLSIQADLFGIHEKIIRQVHVLDFGIEFDPIEVHKVYVTGRLVVLFKLPSNIHISFRVIKTKINFTMQCHDQSDIGRMILDDLPVEHNQTNNELLVNFTKQELIVLSTMTFKRFAADLVLTSNISVIIKGSATALAETRIGNIMLSNIPINDEIQIVGYNHFNSGLLTIDNIDIVRAISPRALALQVRTRIKNPSVISILSGGRFTLQLCDSKYEALLGSVTIDPFHLEPHGNVTILDAHGTFEITRENASVAEKFISNMISGIHNQVELCGKLASKPVNTSVPLLSIAISGLTIQTQVPGLANEKALVREIIIKKLTSTEITGIAVGLVQSLSVRIRIENPFSTSLMIQRMSIRADFGAVVDEKLQIGMVNDINTIRIDSHQELISPYINVTLTGKLSTMAAMLPPLLSGNIRLSLSGTINVNIDGDFALIRLPITALNVIAGQEERPSIK